MGGAKPNVTGGRRRYLRVSSLLVGLIIGCQSAPPPGTYDSANQWDGIRPTLEEIFLEPSVMGTPPLIDKLSPDGRYLLVRWSQPAQGDDDEEPREDARLIDINDPEGSGARGWLIADLLPPLSVPAPDEKAREDQAVVGDQDPDEQKQAEVGPVIWSHHGHTLAVGRGGDIYLIDPATRVCTSFFSAEVREEEEEEEEGAESETKEPRRIEKRITSLAFTPADDALRFADTKELYSLPFPGPSAGLPVTPHSLEEATCWSEAIDPPALRVRWSLDLGVCFGEDPTPLAPEEPVKEQEASEENQEDAEDAERAKDEELDGDQEIEEAPVYQVYRLDEGRGITLVGMKEEKWLERMAISQDGRFVVGAAYDRSREPEKNLIPDYLTDRVSTRTTRNQRADDLPSPFQLWVWNTLNGERRPVLANGPRTLLPEVPENGDVEANTDEANTDENESSLGAPYRLRTIGWAPQPSAAVPARFAFELYSQDFRELSVWCWTEGFCEKLWEERDPAWIGGPVRNTRWTKDGRFLLIGSESSTLSSRPGHAQLFLIDPDSLEIRQLTAVAGEISRFSPLAAGGILIEASRDDPRRRQIGRIDAKILEEPIAKRTALRDIVHWFHVPVGFNSASAGSRDGTHIAFRHARLFEPNEIWAADLERSYQVTRTRPEAFDSIEWIHPERISVASPDGSTVHAHLYLPPGTSSQPKLDEAKPRATIVFVHGAGYLQNVTDSMTRYPLNLMFHSRLAQMGYPVIDVDYRGSAGYGRDFRTDVQYHLGGKDLDDIHLIVDELHSRGVVDGKRVGIYGGSYGGFMAMMALFTAGERWSVGAALRSVTDWRTYNPWYTQPRLGRPSTHAEAYERSSPIDHVDKLDDPLLVLHGLVDSNVFAQDSIRLIEELIDRGKDFDAMLYPSQGHGFEDGPHWLDEYSRIERYLLRHLGLPLQP